MRVAAVLGACALVLSGCGSESAVIGVEPVASPYDGPMSVAIDHSDEATVLERSGAAGRALECNGEPFTGGGADYESGLASAQDSAEKALEDLFEEDFGGWSAPDHGYRVEREDDGRVLFSYDVGGRTKVAFVAADDTRDWKKRTGWGIESWAQCDPAELPASVTDDLGIDVWTDASGARVPLTEVESWPGPEHCDWDDITFLQIGADPLGLDRTDEEYLRDTRGELADHLTTTFSPAAKLPDRATDTGWRHDGRQLWLVPDRSAAYLVSVDDPEDVERWPAAKDPIGCD